MYAGTKFNWIDNSGIADQATIEELDNRALALVTVTSDKGTEQLTRLTGQEFYDMVGTNLSFKRHGQGLLQAARIIDAGGELLFKRFVANDAKLSNLILCANVTAVDTAKTNANGDPLYVDATTGEETTTADGNNPIMLSSASVKWTAETCSEATTVDDVMTAAEALFNDEGGVYPLLVITDIGRNADVKKFRLTPQYEISKSLGFMMYRMSELEGTTELEFSSVTINPSIIYRNTSYAINDKTMKQLNTQMMDNVFTAYITKLSDCTGMEISDLSKLDVVFGCNLKGVKIDGIDIDGEGINLAYENGLSLQSGSDGTEYGDTPYLSEAFAQDLVDFYSGNVTDDIYDVDVHKIAFICDACYPTAVKNAMTAFANFREDLFVFRDLGLGLTTYSEIEIANDELIRSRYAANYLTSYQVTDPYTQKRIEVSMMYDLAPLLVGHFNRGAANPVAGQINNFVLESAIEGTINYIPKNTPNANQKDLLDDARINYATYYEFGGDLIVESLYTSQEANTQLSYINNVLAIQEVIRAIRTACPENRFKFQTSNDFTDYEENVNKVLNAFTSWFSTLNFRYTQDDVNAAQKIFYASIEFSFNNWEQSEIFDLYALPTVTMTEES